MMCTSCFVLRSDIPVKVSLTHTTTLDYKTYKAAR